MIIDVRKLDNSALDIDLKIDAGRLDLESESARMIGDAGVVGQVSNSDRVTVIEAQVSALISNDCHRCLKEVTNDIEFEFSAAYVAPENYTDDQEMELEVNDLEVSIFEGFELDISDVVREQIVLALPGYFVCSESCKGLCEKCGQNLNVKECNCRETDTDPRWAALKGLKK